MLFVNLKWPKCCLRNNSFSINKCQASMPSLPTHLTSTFTRFSPFLTVCATNIEQSKVFQYQNPFKRKWKSSKWESTEIFKSTTTTMPGNLANEMNCQGIVQTSKQTLVCFTFLSATNRKLFETSIKPLFSHLVVPLWFQRNNKRENRIQYVFIFLTFIELTPLYNYLLKQE